MKSRNIIFVLRVIIIGIGFGLIMFFTIDKLLGIGWICGYLLAILFSRLQENARESEPQKERKS